MALGLRVLVFHVPVSSIRASRVDWSKGTPTKSVANYGRPSECHPAFFFFMSDVAQIYTQWM